MDTFQQILIAEGFALRDVTLIRHQTTRNGQTPYALWMQHRPDFELYQSTQQREPKFTKAKYWAAFVAPRKLETLFVGIYEAKIDEAITIDWSDPLGGGPVGGSQNEKYGYWRTELSDRLSEHIGVLQLDWTRSVRSWAQHAANSLKPIVPGTFFQRKSNEPIVSVSETERLALANARIGQGRFRADLEGLWNYRCAASGLVERELLRASHIKPWRMSNNAERLDPRNGLLLAAHLDALFDAGLLSFSDEGEPVLSKVLTKDTIKQLKLRELKLSPLHPSTKTYLAAHRSRIR
jgi:hypothetical protein